MVHIANVAKHLTKSWSIAFQHLNTHGASLSSPGTGYPALTRAVGRCGQCVLSPGCLKMNSQGWSHHTSLHGISYNPIPYIHFNLTIWLQEVSQSPQLVLLAANFHHHACGADIQDVRPEDFRQVTDLSSLGCIAVYLKQWHS